MPTVTMTGFYELAGFPRLPCGTALAYKTVELSALATGTTAAYEYIVRLSRVLGYNNGGKVNQ